MRYLTQKTIIPKVEQFLRERFPLTRDKGLWTIKGRAFHFGYTGPNPRRWFNMFLRDGRPIPESIYTAMGYTCTIIKTPIKRRYVKITGD